MRRRERRRGLDVGKHREQIGQNNCQERRRDEWARWRRRRWRKVKRERTKRSGRDITKRRDAAWREEKKKSN